MGKLLVIPGYCDNLGGMVVSVSAIATGFQRYGAEAHLAVLVRAGSLMERYLQETSGGTWLEPIAADNQKQFFQRAIAWVNRQPTDWPLLLENCVSRQLLGPLLRCALPLRLSGRPVYHTFRDQALSPHPLGGLTRRLAFACLNPQGICNSHYTAGFIRGRLCSVSAILYPAVDTEKRFNNRPPVGAPPENLQPFLQPGSRLLLSASRLSEPDKINDKNLRMLPHVLARLNRGLTPYYGVVIGMDNSPGQVHTQALLAEAARCGVANRFGVLPPTFAIPDYYKRADVVLALAPREPFGRTVVEAVACGTPVVGSCSGGIGESLRNFAPQWTADPHDPAAIAKAIENLLADPQTPERLAAGRRWIEEHCNPLGYARYLLQLTGIAVTPTLPTLSQV